jgi:hypothetical protein
MLQAGRSWVRFPTHTRVGLRSCRRKAAVMWKSVSVHWDVQHMVLCSIAVSCSGEDIFYDTVGIGTKRRMVKIKLSL